MDKETAQIMWQVFQWAYQNDITIMLTKHRTYGNAEFPVIRFSRNDKHIERAFHQLSYFSKEINHYWREIALALCVEPLELESP
jgi:hypothetical protein